MRTTPFIRRSILWQASRSGYALHRIPGMIVTTKGTLIVYNEARYDSCNWAKMDIFMQRSTDGGISFGQRIYLAGGTEEHQTVNNPVMVEDPSGIIHFLYCEDYTINGGRVLHMRSSDDGQTWSEPEDVTHCTKPDYRNAFALGPGHGIMTDDGTLVIPVWMVPKRFASPLRQHYPSVISTLYSTDSGKTWKLGDILESNSDVISPNETTAALTSDGEVYLNIRNNSFRRAIAYSKNGHSDWHEYAPDPRLVDAICYGSCTNVRLDGKSYILFANCATTDGRKCVTVKLSADGGKTWPAQRIIDEERGGYVELASDNTSGNIYCLYEENAGQNMHLVTFNLEWLMENTDKE